MGKTIQPLTEKDINLVKFFLTSNNAISHLKNEHLGKLIPQLPHPNSFTRSFVPRVNKIIIANLEEKLKKSSSICLILDLWSDIGMRNYLAVASCMIFKSFSKELRILGMELMSESSTAENIKIAVEKIINRFQFDKRKIFAIVCDQGSALVRLFRQNENSLFDSRIEEIDIQLNNFSENQTNIENDDLDNILENDVLDELETEERLIESNSNLRFEMSEIDREIDQIINERPAFVRASNEPDSDDEDEDNENEELLNENISDPVNFLELEIGSHRISRYSCAAHKINLVVRYSIKKVSGYLHLLSSLSNYASNIRRSTVLSYEFIAKKAKLRCENGTRWSSSYLMLLSFYSAYEKNAFPSENLCPVSKEKILGLMKILHSLYTFSILSQKSDWHIGDVIPGLIVLSLWYGKSYDDNISERCIESFNDAVIMLLDDEQLGVTQEQSRNERNRAQTSAYDKSENAAFNLLVESVPYEPTTNRERITIIEKISREKEIFLDLIGDKTSLSISTKEFWIANSKIPLLSSVARKIFCVTASSAFIERYFSICGIVSSKRSQNVNPQNFKTKVFLRVNNDLLK
ncbi:unnamed protein product [Brachionus calyciflorus]|uniref:HAT C-terminal dimerisation domain-containing protein n=1 Tax=Brachionus calyciflorus TaxID=104777 RepID=A0A814LJP8_9BILA|nr:unnamed protein product [Brachionus calyciflorus]